MIGVCCRAGLHPAHHHRRHSGGDLHSVHPDPVRPWGAAAATALSRPPDHHHRPVGNGKGREDKLGSKRVPHPSTPDLSPTPHTPADLFNLFFVNKQTNSLPPPSTLHHLVTPPHINLLTKNFVLCLHKGFSTDINICDLSWTVELKWIWRREMPNQWGGLALTKEMHYEIVALINTINTYCLLVHILD